MSWRGSLVAFLFTTLVTGCSCSQTGIDGWADAPTDSSPDISSDAPHDFPIDSWHEPAGPDAPWRPGDDGCVSPYGWGPVILPDVGEDEVVAETLGERVRISSDHADPMGSSSVVWTGSEWGVAWSEGTYMFRRLGADGTPVGTVKVVDSWIEPVREAPGLAWAHESFAYAVEDRTVDNLYAGILGPGGHPLYGPSIIGDDTRPPPDIAGYQAVPGFLFTYAVEGSYGDTIHAQVGHLDERGVLTSPTQRAGTVMRWSTSRIAAFCEMASVTYLKEGYDLWQRSFAWPAVEEGPAETWLASIVALDHMENHVAVPFRDRVAVAWNNGSGTFTLVYSPLTGETLSGPTLINDVGLVYDVALAPAHDRGFLGMCFNDRWDIRFQIIGPDGAAVGKSVQVPSPDPHYRCNAVAWSGSEFLVTYQIVGDVDGEYFGLWGQRFRPLI